MADGLHYFTAEAIVIGEEGKKKVKGLPSGWQLLTEDNIKQHISLDKGHKVKCIRTGKLNNITVIDFDTPTAYKKAIKKYPELNTFFTTKTPRGYHVYGNYNANIKTSTNKLKKIDVRNDGGFVFGVGTIREDGEIYKNFVEGDLNNDFPQEFLDYVVHQKEKKKNKVTSNIKEEKNTTQKEELILDMIHTKYISSYDSWLKIMWAMRSDDEVSEVLAKRISKKADNYNDESFKKIWNDTKYGKEISKKTYYYYAKKSNEKQFYKICQQHDSCQASTIAIANMFIELAGDSVVCDMNECIYVFDNALKKWRVDSSGDITCNLIEDIMIPYYTLLKDSINKEHDNCAMSDEKKAEELYAKYKNCETILGMIDSLANGSTLYKVIRRKIKAVEHDIRFNMLESQTNNLHFKNGVLDVMTGVFRQKDKYDYMTLSLSWNYIEDIKKIDTTVLNDVKSIFHKMELNENINNFIKSWLFYCLTGSTDKQIFLFQLGESAANGKSTMFSIMSKCFEFYTFKLDSKVFDLGYQSAHKQFIKLITHPVRFAYIEEIGEKRIDGQLLKDTVDGEINVNAMYGNADVCKSQAKINIAGNGIVSVKIDNGVSRRMKVKECVSQFLPTQEVDDYENMIFVCDESLAKKFENDMYKNALLHILLEHKNLVVPDEVNKYTTEIQSDCDPFKNELDKHFIFTEEETDRTSVDEIEEFLKKYSSKGIKTNMRRIGYKLDINKTHNKKKGCYLKIRLKKDTDE